VHYTYYGMLILPGAHGPCPTTLCWSHSEAQPIFMHIATQNSAVKESSLASQLIWSRTANTHNAKHAHIRSCMYHVQSKWL